MVALPQLLDIITGFGQDSTFTLQGKANKMRTKSSKTSLHTLGLLPLRIMTQGLSIMKRGLPCTLYSPPFLETMPGVPARYQGLAMTWPDLVLSIEQSGMILDSCTIQLLILSRRRRSTAGQGEGHGDQ